MAVYRHIHIDYWQDGFVLDLTPEERYFYIYLMTNSKTSQCGIYELPKRIMETETGYNRETIDKLIERFEKYKKIVYCEDSKEIFLINWVKHNKIVSPKVKKCVEKELLYVKRQDLVNLFLEECDRYGYTIDTHVTKGNTTMDRVCIPIAQVDFNYNDHYGEKEKEKEKQKEKEKEKQKQKQKEEYTEKDDCLNLEIQKNSYKDCTDSKCVSGVGKFKILYEQNVGFINSIVEEWLFEVCENTDYDLFKKAIEIATNKGKCNKSYISGILKIWRENKINTIKDLKVCEIKFKDRGDSNGRNKYEYKESKYARELEEEDEGLYRKPSKEQLEQARKWLQK